MSEKFDVIVVGAGAAGLMTAIMCGRAKLNVLLVDGRQKVGAKILMSGGTRCNVTNEQVSEKDFQSESLLVVRNILRSFSSAQAIEFFKELGVEFVLEPGGKYFPSTHSGKTILDSLLREIQKLEVPLHTERKITKISSKDGVFEISGSDFSYNAKSVVLCAGGLSFPSTGSDGTGFSIVEKLGHKLIRTSPSLTPLTTDDPHWKSLSGLTLPVSLTLWVDQKKFIKYDGSFLFTHFGFSGPSVLNISRHWIRLKDKHDVKLRASLYPNETEDSFTKKLLAYISANPKRTIKRFLIEDLSERLVDVILRKIDLDHNPMLSQLKKEERQDIVDGCLNCDLAVTGSMGYAKAEVTAGGIDFKDVHSKTLESKIVPGLFFAGEILDVDGRIGGFNFQWAWSSGVVAAKGVTARLKLH